MKDQQETAVMKVTISKQQQRDSSPVNQGTLPDDRRKPLKKSTWLRPAGQRVTML